MNAQIPNIVVITAKSHNLFKADIFLFSIFFFLSCLLNQSQFEPPSSISNSSPGLHGTIQLQAGEPVVVQSQISVPSLAEICLPLTVHPCALTGWI
jgi:hypothetical protein